LYEKRRYQRDLPDRGIRLAEAAEHTPDLSKLLLPVQPEDHIQGEANARFTLVEYGDYECPDCGRLLHTIRELRARFPEDVRLIFRHYPLSQLAAEAAEAAGAQQRFWKCTTNFSHTKTRFLREIFRTMRKN
jgi:protein-disulfide isomerase